MAHLRGLTTVCMRGVRDGQVKVSSAPSQWAISRGVRQADRDEGRGDGSLTSAEGEELVRLRRENKLALALALGVSIRPLLLLELRY